MTSSVSRWAALAAMICCLAACGHKSAPDASPATPDKQGIVFGDGFQKEEASPAATLRWVRQEAKLQVMVPADGNYQMTFRPFTVFSNVEDTIEVSVNDKPEATFSTHLYDPANPAPVAVKVPLHAGDNNLRLHSRGSERPLTDTDDRIAAYGLVLPIAVERVP